MRFFPSLAPGVPGAAGASGPAGYRGLPGDAVCEIKKSEWSTMNFFPCRVYSAKMVNQDSQAKLANVCLEHSTHYFNEDYSLIL